MSDAVLARFGRVDAVINNAGVADFGPIDETGFDRWRRVMETNLDGVFLVSQAMTPALKASRGALVNIASISGLRASTLRVAYGTSKAGVIQLTRQQAAELGEFGIRANCVCPGPVRTKLAMAVHSQEIIEAYHDAIPLNRYGSEREIAEVIVFLCSEKASYVTGQVIAVGRRVREHRRRAAGAAGLSGADFRESLPANPRRGFGRKRAEADALVPGAEAPSRPVGAGSGTWQ
jgi:meso-butanediol dehydrogenase/(S,S)-butanediol dehydrogenase/diacetyl reductase